MQLHAAVQVWQSTWVTASPASAPDLYRLHMVQQAVDNAQESVNTQASPICLTVSCQPQTAFTFCGMLHCDTELLKSMLEMASFLGSIKVLRTDGTEVSITLALV